MENNAEYLTYQLEEMYPAYQWIIHTRYKIPPKIIKGLGATEWYSLLHEIVYSDKIAEGFCPGKPVAFLSSGAQG